MKNASLPAKNVRPKGALDHDLVYLGYFDDRPAMKAIVATIDAANRPISVAQIEDGCYKSAIMQLADHVVFHRIKKTLYLMNLTKTSLHIEIDGLLADVVERLALQSQSSTTLLSHFRREHDLDKSDVVFLTTQLRSLEQEGFLKPTTKKPGLKNQKSRKQIKPQHHGADHVHCAVD